MSNTLKSKKVFTKSTLKKLGSVAEELANIIMIESLSKKTVEAIDEGCTKIRGIAQMFMYLGNNPAVINLARTIKKMNLIRDNDVRRNQVWTALDEQLNASSAENTEEIEPTE